MINRKEKCFRKFVISMLRPYGLMKGDLKLRGSKAPRRTVATEKIGKQTQHACPTCGKSRLETLNQQVRHL
jgi:hypothetical protein